MKLATQPPSARVKNNGSYASTPPMSSWHVQGSLPFPPRSAKMDEANGVKCGRQWEKPHYTRLITAAKINDSVQAGQPLTGIWYFQITHVTVTIRANEHYKQCHRDHNWWQATFCSYWHYKAAAGKILHYGIIHRQICNNHRQVQWYSRHARLQWWLFRACTGA